VLLFYSIWTMFPYYSICKQEKETHRLFKVVFLTIELLSHFKNVETDLTLLGFHTNTASVKYLAGIEAYWSEVHKSVSVLPQKFIKSFTAICNKAG